MKIGSLFSGIGGLELGLERAGLGPVVWQAEIDPLCRAVLRKHWPNAHLYSDVRLLHEDTQGVDLICGGFPCQDLSSANSSGRLGLSGSKSSLWHYFNRIVARMSPKWVVVENVAKTWIDWVPRVRSDMWTFGYSSVPIQMSARALGAPHERSRIFVVANSNENGESLRAFNEKMAELQTDTGRFGRYWRNAFSGPVRMDDGFSGRLGEVRAYGNAVVPICAEVIGSAIRMCEEP